MRHGFAAQSTGNLPLAQKYYGDCLRLNPRHALALNNLAIVFAQSNLLNEALLTIERAAMCDSTHAVIPQNWALVAMDLERVNEAVAQARRAVEMAPNEIGPKLLLAMLLTAAGKPEESVSLYNQILDKEPAHPSAGINAAFVQTLTDAGPKEMLAQRHRWYEGNRYKGVVGAYTNDKDPNRPLRVGYVGGDFKSHSAAFIFRRVLFHHTPAVEPYFYSSLPVDVNADAQTRKFQEVAGPRWRDISTMPDVDAAAMIRQDKIDILVDLAAHTNGGRLGLFTHRPAPIQVTGWGFAHGTGSSRRCTTSWPTR
jgi:protein O-GlcNAc transferase